MYIWDYFWISFPIDTNPTDGWPQIHSENFLLHGITLRRMEKSNTFPASRHSQWWLQRSISVCEFKWKSGTRASGKIFYILDENRKMQLETSSAYFMPWRHNFWHYKQPSWTHRPVNQYAKIIELKCRWNLNLWYCWGTEPTLKFLHLDLPFFFILLTEISQIWIVNSINVCF